MDPRLAELTRTIDPSELGRRIRNARVAAGMTQAQVAGDEVSAAYVSRIEDGQRRPEAGLLERMAARMSTTLEALVLDIELDKLRELELAVDHAELALVSGNASVALAASGAVLADLSDKAAGTLRTAALRIRAGALEAEGDLGAAIAVLEELVADPSGDANWLRSLIALSRCYRDSGDFANAINVGDRAAQKIDELGIAGLTEAIQLTVTVAAAYHRQGDTDVAMRVCQQAMRDAERYNSPIAKASAYWNASTIEAATHGATVAAVAMAKKALALFEHGEDNRNLAKLRAEVATLQLAQEPPDAEAALATLASAEAELAWSGASSWEIALLHITRARAHLLLGQLADAVHCVAQGVETAPEQAPFLHASAQAVLGQVAVAEGRVDDARAAYRKAVLALTGAGADRSAAQLWFELANLLTEVGDVEGAVQAFRSAGASSGLRVGTASGLLGIVAGRQTSV